MIEVQDLTKFFGKTHAVDHLTFAVRPGSVTGFLGPNGAGKSTTMRMILGLDNPTAGTALIGGKRYAELHQPMTKVGSLLDANWIHPNRSARSHLRWMARANGIKEHRVQQVLDLVGLTEVAGKAAGQFSLGMKQRLGLAGALLGDPEVLLFDEPVNGLDPEGILWIRTFMRRLAAQGRTVLVSSHLLSEMAQTADHLIVIGRGRLIADSSTKDFISAATRSTVRVRSPRAAELQQLMHRDGWNVQAQDGALVVTDTPIEQIGDLAAAAGIALHELSPQSGSLEEAFMQLTGESAQYASHWDPGAPPAGGVVDPYATAGALVPGAVPAGAMPAGSVPAGAMPSAPGPITGTVTGAAPGTMPGAVSTTGPAPTDPDGM
jgi:ABC-2 type transport system ATP-binding protein